MITLFKIIIHITYNNYSYRTQESNKIKKTYQKILYHKRKLKRIQIQALINNDFPNYLVNE